jgi:glucose-6-phosphate 1-dehydrogenase
MTAAGVALNTVRGQYTGGKIDGKSVPGYRTEEGVARGSNVETYAAIKLGIDNWRWAGVPFYLRAGKRLAHRVTEIAVHFKRTPQALFRHVEGLVPRNAVVFRIQPDEGIGLTFGAKVPGQGMETARVRMSFDYEHAFGMDIPAAYETLLLDVVQGDATLFTRGDEAEAQWSLITPILDAWSDGAATDLKRYPAGTDGPKAAADLLARDGRAWRPLDALVQEEKVAGTSR